MEIPKGIALKKVENKTVITITEEINDWGFCAYYLQYQLDYAKEKKEGIEIQIASLGGDVFAGLTIYNLIKSYPYVTSCIGIGVVASIASVILMAADKVSMMKSSFLMIHNTSGLVNGGSEDLKKYAELMDKMNLQIADIYVSQIIKNGKEKGATPEELKTKMLGLMAKETWLTCQEALDMGIIGKCYDEKLTAGEEPTADQESDNTPMEEEAEQIKNILKSNRFSNIPIRIQNSIKSMQNNAPETLQKKKGIFAKFMAFFSNEIAAEEEQSEQAPAQPETPETPQPEMTEEQLVEMLRAKGYKVEMMEKETPQPEAPAKEELVALKNQLKEQAIALEKAQGKGIPTSATTTHNTPAKTEKSKFTQQELAVFSTWGKMILSSNK
jgi:ATP-dependent protease ClpP protease subunit